MPSETIWVAIVTAVAGIIGGVIGAIASPVGRDWVAKREDVRQRERVREAHEREQLAADTEDARQRERTRDTHERERRAAEEADRRAAVQETLNLIAEAMRHYEAEWRGIATYHAAVEARRAGNQAWVAAQALDDERCRESVADWKTLLEAADMSYREGAPPAVHQTFEDAYRVAADCLGPLLRRT